MGSIIEILKLLSLPLFAYLIGSIPFGVVLTRLFTDIDLSTQGSGNIGATNVLRCAGIKLGLMTLLLDIFKGALPVYLAIALLSTMREGVAAFPYLVAMCAFLGHLYPLYFGLRKGGKGVATAWGCFLALSPFSAFLVLLIFAVVVVLFKRVSLSSLAAAMAMPLTIGYVEHALLGSLFGAMMALFITYRHRQNIKRLLRGEELPIWGRKP